MLITLLRSRAFALCMHLVLWTLLLLCLLNLSSTSPQFIQVTTPSTSVASPVPTAKITNLFSSRLWTRHDADTNLLNPFFTRHFIPPVVPPPPPPTTKSIQVTYHGFYQTGDDPAHAFLTVDKKTVTGPVGLSVAAPWSIAAMSREAVLLTNRQGQTNVIPFNKSKAIQVPAQ